MNDITILLESQPFWSYMIFRYFPFRSACQICKTEYSVYLHQMQTPLKHPLHASHFGTCLSKYYRKFSNLLKLKM